MASSTAAAAPPSMAAMDILADKPKLQKDFGKVMRQLLRACTVMWPRDRACKEQLDKFAIMCIDESTPQALREAALDRVMRLWHEALSAHYATLRSGNVAPFTDPETFKGKAEIATIFKELDFAGKLREIEGNAVSKANVLKYINTLSDKAQAYCLISPELASRLRDKAMTMMNDLQQGKINPVSLLSMANDPRQLTKLGEGLVSGMSEGEAVNIVENMEGFFGLMESTGDPLGAQMAAGLRNVVNNLAEEDEAAQGSTVATSDWKTQLDR